MRYLLAFLLIISTGIVLAQSDNNFTVIGKITDGSNQQPLSKASVFCQNTTFGTLSDNEGAFKLSLPNGGYDLVISYTGFETRTLHINQNGADNPKYLLCNGLPKCIVPKKQNARAYAVWRFSPGGTFFDLAVPKTSTQLDRRRFDNSKLSTVHTSK